MSQFNQSPYADLRPQAASASQVDARAAFIVRTYAHLFLAIAAFTLLEVVYFSLGVNVPLTQLLVGSSMGWLLFLGGMVGVSWIARGLASNTRNVMAQYAGLGAFVVMQSILFVPLLTIANAMVPGGGMIASAAGVSFVGFAALTAIVFATRKDFSFLGSILMWGMAAAMLLIVGALIFGFTLGLFFSVAMVALAGAAILYDTSNILHHWDTDQHVGAALELFASVMLFFWYILSIFMHSRD